ncbi:YebC/PmpR family DNA-binding transcriptional regulator [Candidatus Kaiserbacteria bacterium]|nr:YebC/PmpR family DNA-binding transcriptional regulator [Candidatus Kaiserbacteria bacterium]
MSGHNKWSQIKHKKAATDAKKSRVFGKLSRLISSEVKKAQGNAHAPGLRRVIEKARQANMPTENIQRAVEKGKTDGTEGLEEVVYEAYGPGGVAMVISGMTDNKNRTGAEIKHLLAEHGLALAEPGAALWAFEKSNDVFQAKTRIPLSPEDKEKLDVLKDTLSQHDEVSDIHTNEA